MAGHAVGSFVSAEVFSAPASMSRTRVAGSALSRAASMQPDEPAPTITSSNRSMAHSDLGEGVREVGAVSGCGAEPTASTPSMSVPYASVTNQTATNEMAETAAT